jgi:hypothetical protein
VARQRNSTFLLTRRRRGRAVRVAVEFINPRNDAVFTRLETGPRSGAHEHCSKRIAGPLPVASSKLTGFWKRSTIEVQLAGFAVQPKHEPFRKLFPSSLFAERLVAFLHTLRFILGASPSDDVVDLSCSLPTARPTIALHLADMTADVHYQRLSAILSASLNQR